MHIVGVPVIENCNRGMKKQVGKTKLFTKESLTEIQDRMRTVCIKSFNKVYNNEIRLKEKQKGRNKDINVKDMKDYKIMKEHYAKHNLKIKRANEKTDKVYTFSTEIKEILDNLKPTKLNKNVSVIPNNEIDKIKDYIEEVKDTTKTMNSVNDLNIIINEFEHSYNEIDKENRSLKYQLECKDEEIGTLKSDVSDKDKAINKLRAEKESLKTQLKKFKEFWHSIMNHFHKRVNYDKDENYKIVSDDLHKSGIFSDDDFEIATNIWRKVEPKVEKNDRWKIRQ